jgi:hypothetical protein
MTRFSLNAIFLFFLHTFCFSQTVQILNDIYPGPLHGFDVTTNKNNDFVSVGSQTFFKGKDSAYPFLYQTDGTGPGTKKVRPVNGASDIDFITRAGNHLFYLGTTNTNGLCVFNTTTQSESLVLPLTNLHLKGIFPLSEQQVLLCISKSPSNDPTELWVSNGTSVGTLKIGDLSIKPLNTNVSFFRGSTLISEKHPQGTPFEPIISNGTTAGTSTLLSYLKPLHPSFNRIQGALATDELLLVQGLTNNGINHIVTDGTVIGTKTLPLSGEIQSIFKHSSDKYFITSGSFVYLYDFKINSLITLSSYATGRGEQVQGNGRIYFFANYNGNSSIGMTDGTSAGTLPLASLPSFTLFSKKMIFAGSSLFCNAFDQQGTSLYRINAFTGDIIKVTDLLPNQINFSENDQPVLGFVNNKLLFGKLTSQNGFELWTTNEQVLPGIELKTGEPLKIYPNLISSKNEITIDKTMVGSGSFNVLIYNYSGIKIFEESYNEIEKVIIAGSLFSTGNYSISIMKDNVIHSGSLVVID